MDDSSNEVVVKRRETKSRHPRPTKIQEFILCLVPIFTADDTKFYAEYVEKQKNKRGSFYPPRLSFIVIC